MSKSLSLETLEFMSEEEEAAFMEVFDAEIASDDGEEARSHLAAGRPITYWEEDIPSELLKREYPSGRIEVVDFHTNPERVVRVIKE